MDNPFTRGRRLKRRLHELYRLYMIVAVMIALYAVAVLLFGDWFSRLMVKNQNWGLLYGDMLAIAAGELLLLVIVGVALEAAYLWHRRKPPESFYYAVFVLGIFLVLFVVLTPAINT